MARKTNTFNEYLQGKLKSKTFKEVYDHYGNVLEIGMQVRSLREKAGMTQTELAKRLKVSQQVISRIESGESDNPTVSTLERIAKATGHQLSLRFMPA
jgi:HTH-type transcriptional regulator / antitoxin HipB